MQQNPANRPTDMERTLAATALLYGLTILNPWTEVFTGYQAYAVIARHGSETLWGGLMTAVGLGHLTAIYLDGIVARRLSCFFAASVWLFLAWLYFLGRIEDGVFTSITSPGVMLFILWGWMLARHAFKLR